MPQKFIPKSPDKYLKKGADTSLVKFGQLNFLLNQMNNNVYADNTAALAGGLKKGDFYRTSTGQVMIVF